MMTMCTSNDATRLPVARAPHLRHNIIRRGISNRPSEAIFSSAGPCAARIFTDAAPKRIALPVFASDALSSNAYATQEILLMLSVGGVALCQLHTVGRPRRDLGVLRCGGVVSPERSCVPSGGGDYEVVSTNLGERAGVFVAKRLMVDYVMTVAVSISSAVANIASAFPPVGKQAVIVAVGLIVIMTLMNLRGFANPGRLCDPNLRVHRGDLRNGRLGNLADFSDGTIPQAESATWEIEPETTASGALLIFLLARAFSSGTTALTGIEAIANGVPAFKKPKSKNAATTLLLLGVISMSMFAAITWLAMVTNVRVTEHNENLIGLPPGQEQKTVIAQVSQAVFSDFQPGYL